MEKAPEKLELIIKYFSGFTTRQVEQLTALDALYREWNAQINVISRKDIDGLYEKHVLHSMSIVAGKIFPPGSEIIDIGTGGGFPGIPLAIFLPEVHFHLVDSIGKKLKVVEQIKSAIGLQNVTTEHTRAEDIRNRRFDYAVSRAVAPLNELWQWSRPLLRKKSRENAMEDDYYSPGLICLKGGDLQAEIKECPATVSGVEILEIFQEEFFRQKFVLHVR